MIHIAAKIITILAILLAISGCSMTPRGSSTKSSSSIPGSPTAGVQAAHAVDTRDKTHELATECSSTKIHTEPLNDLPNGLLGLKNTPWILALPESAGVTGHLFFGDQPLPVGGKFASGASAKILWTIPKGGAALLEISGRNLKNGSDTYAAKFPLSSGADYPSVINVPSPGCWRFTLTSGSVSATVTLLASQGL